MGELKSSKAVQVPIRQRIENPDLNLTISEARIVQILLSDYPMSGLGTQTGLAKKAAVSDPTVLRFVTKLGFDGFPAFQASLLEEVEAKLRSPLMMAGAKRSSSEESGVRDYLASVTGVLQEAQEGTVSLPYERAVTLIMSAKKVLVLGGRFSRHVAGMFCGYLTQFRPAVTPIGPLSTENFDLLVDVSKRDTIIIFDYRRYQTDVVEFARQAASRGARIILFTDPWLSPIAEFAEVLITGKVEVDSPFDTLVTSVAQMEAVVAQIVHSESAAMHRRAGELESVRSANAATIENGPS